MTAGTSFGRWLQRRRKALDLTQEQLAQRGGCAAETLRKIEADARRPSRQIAERLADALELAAGEREIFIRSARAELSADRLAPPAQRVTPLPLPANFPPLASAADRRSNLPAPLTTFVGREAEVATISTLLHSADVRLLTLTGPGGIGKTRLAMEAARELLDAFLDGVQVVDLAPVRAPDMVAAAIAQTLDLHAGGGQTSLDHLKEFLRAKRLLLVLDNFEHIVSAAPDVADLLVACPALKVLVTSRVRLKVRGEKELIIPPLALPASGQLVLPGAQSHSPAVELFVARAQDVQPRFVVTAENAATVAAICARLDGLPLALELAAARMKLFTPHALLERLTQRLALLTGGAQDLPARQQTIRATIDWSEQLLTPEEQHLFARLGIFIGGWTLAAAEALCEPEGEPPLAVLDGLTSLVDKSLVQHTTGTDAEPRFSMLETIREYALERLEQRGELDTLRQRYAAYYLAFVEQAEQAFRGPDARLWMDRVQADEHNIAAVLSWSLATPGQLEVGVRIAGALGWYWDQRAQARGDLWLSRMSASLDAQVRPALRAKLLTTASYLANMLGDGDRSLALAGAALDVARAAGERTQLAWALNRLGHVSGDRSLLEESLALFRAGEDSVGCARTLMSLGLVAQNAGDVARAIPLLEESLALFRRLGDRSGVSDILAFLGQLVQRSGDARRAVALYEEGLTLAREAGDRWGTAFVLSNLGRAKFEQGELAEAAALLRQSATICRDQGTTPLVGEVLTDLGDLEAVRGDDQRAGGYYEQSVAIYEEVGDAQRLARVRSRLGLLAYRQGNHAQAARLLTESLRSLQRLGITDDLADVCLSLAAVAVERRQPEVVARLLGTAEAVYEARGRGVPPVLRREHEAALAAGRAALDEVTFQAAREHGRLMTPQQVLTEASKLLPSDH